MKLIIDIPKEAYNRLLTEQHLPNRLDIEWCIIHGTPIPDNATNGDVIKAIFPTYKYKEGARFASVVNDNGVVEIWNTWWNAPYKGGQDADSN